MKTKTKTAATKVTAAQQRERALARNVLMLELMKKFAASAAGRLAWTPDEGWVRRCLAGQAFTPEGAPEVAEQLAEQVIADEWARAQRELFLAGVATGRSLVALADREAALWALTVGVGAAHEVMVRARRDAYLWLPAGTPIVTRPGGR